MRILSGGQTGVDRAALDVALACRLAVGGWCPRGRWAEDGAIPGRYPLRETPSVRPEQRTFLNVRDSEATLILVTGGPPAGGTAAALSAARAMGRPWCVADPFGNPAAAATWLHQLCPRSLNIAGPRESEAPGVYGAARRFLLPLLSRFAATRRRS